MSKARIASAKTNLTAIERLANTNASAAWYEASKWLERNVFAPLPLVNKAITLRQSIEANWRTHG